MQNGAGGAYAVVTDRLRQGTSLKCFNDYDGGPGCNNAHQSIALQLVELRTNVMTPCPVQAAAFTSALYMSNATRKYYPVRNSKLLLYRLLDLRRSCRVFEGLHDGIGSRDTNSRYSAMKIVRQLLYVDSHTAFRI